MQNSSLAHPIFGFSLHRHAGRQLRDHFIPNASNQHVPHVLHHRALFLYSLLLVLVKLSVLASPLLLPYNLGQTSAVTSENIVSLSNQSRVDFDLPALMVSPKLEVAALNKARDMMKSGYFAHFSPEGVSPWFWIQQSGYSYSYAGENLAIRFSTAEGVNAAWLASAAHRSNILSKDFTQIGVAVLTEEFGKEGAATLVVQMFGAPAVQTAVAKTEEPKVQPVKVLPKVVEQPASVSESPTPQITFPLQDSFMNKSVFRVIGEGQFGDQIRIYINDRLYGQTAVTPAGQFEYVLPAEESLSDGPYVLHVRQVDAEGKESRSSSQIEFLVDTTPPQIFENAFSFIPSSGQIGAYDVTAGVSDDSIRTLVTVGDDSAALERQQGKTWSGKITLFNAKAGDDLPIQIYAQDLAGNETKQRVGLLSGSDVKGVFSFVSGQQEAPKQEMKLFGGFVTIADFGAFAQKFYLAFVVFLASALVLKVGIKRHIHHPRTVAATAGVMMLAMILFTF